VSVVGVTILEELGYVTAGTISKKRLLLLLEVSADHIRDLLQGALFEFH
jgi:hypothetical protein